MKRIRIREMGKREKNQARGNDSGFHKCPPKSTEQMFLQPFTHMLWEIF